MTQTDKLEALFATMRQSEPYLPDDGFTARVITRLPKVRELPEWQKNGILLAFTALGSAIAAWMLPVDAIIGFSLANLLTLPVIGAIGAAMFLLSGAIVWLTQAEVI